MDTDVFVRRLWGEANVLERIQMFLFVRHELRAAQGWIVLGGFLQG